MNILLSYLPQIITSVVAILLVPASKFIIRRTVRKYSILRARGEARMLQVIHITSIAINLSCFIVLAIIWGVRPQNMWIALSSIIAFVGVGLFAQWSILSNITAGIIIFFSTPFRIGDKIQIHDKDMPLIATVESIMTFYMHLRTEEGELVVIPNTLFFYKTVSLLKEKDSDK